MKVSEQRRISGLLQAAADELAAGLPDRITLALKDDRFLFASDVWTSAMTRERLELEFSVGRKGAAKEAVSGAVSWDDAATSIVDELVGDTIAVQEGRWTLARARGLIRDGIPHDLTPGDMMIDRTLQTMLAGTGIDAAEAATRIAPFREFQVGEELPSVTVGANQDGIFARQLGAELPVISSWVTLRHDAYVCFDGTYLALDGTLPDSVMDGVAGRPLGDVIGTGVPELDLRTIAGIFAFGEHPHGTTIWDEALTLYVQLAPDHVRLGAPQET